jgi:hypothetical protein
MKTKLLLIGILVLLFNNQLAQLLKTTCSFIFRLAGLMEKLPEVL